MRALAAVAVLLIAAPSLAQETGEGKSSKGYIEMPKADDGAWVLTNRPGSGRNWGTPEFVRHVAMVAREWKRRHPEGPAIRIGDMSKPDGANFPPHKTHKDGLTADIFTTPKNICHVSYPDQELTLELAQLFYDYGAKQILYNHPTVTKALAVAKKWPKHDNHFHIVIEPSRVPAEGAPLVIPSAGVADGAWISRSALEDEGAGIAVSWRLLGGGKLKGVRVLFKGEGDELLHDSEQQRLRKPRYVVPIAVEDGKTYRWKVEVETGQGAKAECGWQTLRADLVPPKAAVLSPKAEAPQDVAPTLRWRYEKPGVAQAAYRIELDGDSNHRKIAKTLGPFQGAAGAHTLDPKVLKRVKRYFWRVIAIDAHGNEGASEWETFKTSRAYGKAKKQAPGKAPTGGDAEAPAARAGTVTTSLNMRAGPGTDHAVKTVLSKGATVRVLGEQDGWLEVEAKAPNGQPVRGFVSKKFVQF